MLQCLARVFLIGEWATAMVYAARISRRPFARMANRVAGLGYAIPGTVLAVEPRMLPHPSGLSAPCVVIEPDGEERWCDHAHGSH